MERRWVDRNCVCRVVWCWCTVSDIPQDRQRSSDKQTENTRWCSVVPLASWNSERVLATCCSRTNQKSCHVWKTPAFTNASELFTQKCDHWCHSMAILQLPFKPLLWQHTIPDWAAVFKMGDSIMCQCAWVRRFQLYVTRYERASFTGQKTFLGRGKTRGECHALSPDKRCFLLLLENESKRLSWKRTIQ